MTSAAVTLAHRCPHETLVLGTKQRCVLNADHPGECQNFGRFIPEGARWTDGEFEPIHWPGEAQPWWEKPLFRGRLL